MFTLPPLFVWVCLFSLLLLYAVSFVIFGFVFQASFLSFLLLSLKESFFGFFELSWYLRGETAVTAERFMPLYRAAPDRACRSPCVHVPSLSSFRCQLTFIFLHLPGSVGALPGPRDFHYLCTTADTDMMQQSSAIPHSAVIHWPPPGKQHYRRLGN